MTTKRMATITVPLGHAALREHRRLLGRGLSKARKVLHRLKSGLDLIGLTARIGHKCGRESRASRLPPVVSFPQPVIPPGPPVHGGPFLFRRPLRGYPR